jgi:hypothetical protein
MGRVYVYTARNSSTNVLSSAETWIGKKGGEPEGHGIQGTAKGSTTMCTELAAKAQEMKTRHVEATSGSATSAARGSTGTLAAHGAGEERRGRRMHPSRGRSSLHTPARRCPRKRHGRRGELFDGRRPTTCPHVSHKHFESIGGYSWIITRNKTIVTRNVI